MALMDEIRRRVREKHLQKKELARQQQEEQRKELERRQQEEQKKELERRQREQPKKEQTLQSSKPISSGKDNYIRVKGRYGWTWAKQSDNGADSRQQGLTDERPSVRRPLDSALLSSLKTKETRDTTLGSHRSGPVSYVTKTVAASPLSDVTYSQSPSKKSVAFTEGEDPIATARRILMEKELKDTTRYVEDLAIIARRALMEKERKEAARNVEDPAIMARRALMEKECKEAERKESARKEADKSSPVKVVLPPLPRLPVNSSEYVHEDPSEIARRLAREKEEAQARQEKEEERAKQARNPIALLERRNEGRRLFLSSFAERNDATPTKVADSSLWDDSENEGPSEEEEDKKKKKATKKKTSEVKKGAKQRNSFGSASERYADESDDEFDDEFENTLIPTFDNPELGPPSAIEPLKLPSGDSTDDVHEVPASINRYLKPYQREGVAFLYSCIVVRGTGAILGDDMGMGKTVQIISLLASLLRKTGTGKDAIELKRRRRLITQKMREMNAARDEALLYDGVNVASTDKVEVEGLILPERAPILVIVPPTIVHNWLNEFRTWGHFGVGSYQDDRSQALDRVKDGTNEVLLCGSALFLGDFDAIASVRWKLIVVDECHRNKNRNSKGYLRLEELRDACECPIIGLTGTIMQNDHEELWNLIDLVQPGHLGDWKSFKGYISQPILFGRTKTAEADTIQRSISRTHQLADKLKEVYIRRTKETELGDELPDKEETIIFCELTEIQKRLYEYVLTLPDFELLKYSHAPCDCGVNRSIFMGYKRLRNNKERVAYLRRHRNEVTKRKECCYRIPLNPYRDEEGQPFIHPMAPLWMSQHENDEECELCPFCIMFPALNKLYKLASHAALIQAEHDPSTLDVGTNAWKSAVKDVDFAKVAIPPDVLPLLPGGSYVIQDGIMNDHAKLSGKMQKLDKLLAIFSAGDNRVLLFSHWTKTLDLIQQFVQARGYSFIRLDGSTSRQARQPLVDRFQQDKTIFLFLISTKAGGLGLNLTAANKVICFDMDYNPSHDEQAQDRAYRIGQTEDVQVIRLVSRGTIEELKYIRQIYKVQLKQETLGDRNKDGEAARIFRGVQGDKNRKGELYGIENLLKFKDGSFMDDLWKASENRTSKRDKIGLVSVNDLANTLAKVSEAEMDEVGNCFQEAFDKAAASEEENKEDIAEMLGGRNAINHQDFLRSDRGEAALKPGDEGFEEEMGGASQMVLSVLDRGGLDDDDEMESVPEQPLTRVSTEIGDLAKILGGRNAINHQDFLRADRGDAALKPGDDGFEEETGGCSQMVLDILDRGGLDDGDDDHEPQSKQTSPEENILPPRQRYGTGGSIALPLETIEESPPPGEDTTELIWKETAAIPKKKTKKRAASPKGEKSKTTFTARDIFVPTYKKKKSKK